MSMLDKIRAKYNDAMDAKNVVTFSDDEDAENNAIMECASFLSELDDLTVDGNDVNSRRTVDVLNIGFDEDVELESFEVSATDGRILDIPADILVHSESYEYMKSYEDFYNEAYEENHRTNMDDEKINAEAVRMYKEYLTQVFQEGLFSAKKVSLDDPTVQWYRTIDFGPSNPNDPTSTPYVVRLPIGYIAKDGKTILTKQRDTVNVMIDPYPDHFKTFGAKYIEMLNERNYTIPEGKNVWDVVIPKRIIVPEQPVDQFVFVIEAENVLSDKPDNDYLYLGYSAPISALKKSGVSNVTPNALSDKSIKLFTTPASIRNVVDTKSIIREQVEPKPVLNRFVQEAIDFGDDSNPPAPNDGESDGGNTAEINGGGDATSTSSDNGGGDAISGDAGDAGNTDTSTDNTSTSTEDDGPSKAAEDANDVSDKIADKVADETEKQNANDDNSMEGSESTDTNDSLNTEVTDLPEDGEGLENGDDLNLDGIDSSSDESSIDDKLNELNTEGENMDDGVVSDTKSMQDMSFNDMMKAAEDKLKNMSIGDLQAFLNDDTNTNGEAPIGESYVQEAFILTKKNINAELDATIRKCLGDLNDSKLDMDGIIKEFKKDGKKLNRALSKASKMNDLYSEKECAAMVKLNKCLTDLIISMKPDTTKAEFQKLKVVIKSFVSQAKGVAAFVEKHKTDVVDDKKTSDDKKKKPSREVK